MNSHPRVFLGTAEIAGYYAGLKTGFEELGVPVSSFMRTPHPYDYARGQLSERVLQKIGAGYRAIPTREGRQRHPFYRHVPAFQEHLLNRIIRRHDVFIFGAMTSLDGVLTGGPRLRDLKRLKDAGKTVICVFHGSDVRPAWLNGSFIDLSPEDLIKKTHQQLAYLREIEAHADVIVSHPPMAALQHRPFAQYLCVGIPIRTPGLQAPPRLHKPGAPLRVLHAPSKAATKGSQRVQDVIGQLISEGNAIDFQLLSGVSNQKVRQALGQADLLIDQVYSDTPMAHLATEAATQGCPTVVTGNDLENLRKMFSPQNWPPTYIGPPSALKDLVASALANHTTRNEIGEAARNFVHSYWSPKQVAENFLYLAKYGIPAKWRCDPQNHKFLGGYGMTVEQRDRLMKKVEGKIWF